MTTILVSLKGYRDIVRYTQTSLSSRVRLTPGDSAILDLGDISALIYIGFCQMSHTHISVHERRKVTTAVLHFENKLLCELS